MKSVLPKLNIVSVTCKFTLRLGQNRNKKPQNGTNTSTSRGAINFHETRPKKQGLSPYIDYG